MKMGGSGKGKNKPDLYFAYGFVVANGWIVQDPASMAVAAATDASAFDILRDVVKYVTPASPINF